MAVARDVATVERAGKISSLPPWADEHRLEVCLDRVAAHPGEGRCRSSEPSACDHCRDPIGVGGEPSRVGRCDLFAGLGTHLVDEVLYLGT
jgi:hypothetical protein